MKIWRITLILLVGLLIVACTPADSGDPTEAIVTYLNAFVAKDTTALSNAVCADFEADARAEMDSLGAVDASLQDVECTASEDNTSVTCTGSIDIVYDGESTNSLPLDRRAYSVVQDDGEWRMCGYVR